MSAGFIFVLLSESEQTTGHVPLNGIIIIIIIIIVIISSHIAGYSIL
jgi:hypothetical protein